MKKLTLVLFMMLALVGLKTNAAMYIVGGDPFGGWHTYAGAEMTDNGDGTYTYVTDQINGSVWFVFADQLTTGTSDDWDTFNSNYRYGPLNAGQSVTAGVEYTTQKSTNGNVSYNFTGTAGEAYQFTFDTNTMKFKVEGYVAPINYDSYTVAGEPAALFGSEWAPADEANDMILEDGLYTWKKDSVELASGTIKFKVVADHSWTVASWPVDNYEYYLEDGGIYNVTITFNTSTLEVGINAEKVQDGPVIDPLTGDLFILGQVNGNNWDPSTGIEMATTDENIFTLTDATFADSGNGYAYFSFTSKLGENADDWSFSDYRRGAVEPNTLVEDTIVAVLADWGTSNAFMVLPGIYDVEVNLSENTVLLTLKEAPQPEEVNVYIMGNVNGYTWDAINGVQMTYDETNKIYTAEINVNKAENNDLGYFGFTKKLADPESEDPWGDIAAYRFGPDSDGGFIMTENLLGVDCALKMNSEVSIAIPEGTWTVTVNLENNTFKIEGEWPTPEPYDGDVYILGDVNDNGGWFTNVGVKMTRDEENKVYTATITTAGESIPEGEEIGYSYFGFTKQLADSADAWEEIAPYRFGAVSDGDFWVTEEVLNTEIPLKNNGSTFRIPAGTWDLLLSVDNMTLKITKVAFKPGDVNHDGIVDVSDVTATISAALGGTPANFFIEQADMNEDGIIDVSDVTAVIARVLGNN